MHPTFPIAFPDPEQPKAVVPMLRGKGLGEKVCGLLLCVDVKEADGRVLELFVSAGEVNLMCAADVAELGASAPAHNLDCGLVIFHDLQLYIPAKDGAPQLEGGKRLAKEAVRQADHFGFSGRPTDRRLLLADPAQREERVWAPKDEVTPTSRSAVKAVPGEIGVNEEPELQQLGGSPTVPTSRCPKVEWM